MKITHLNYHDIQGGAARAAYRIHHSLIYEGVESRMTVISKKSDDHTVDLYQTLLPKRVFFRGLEVLIKYASRIDRSNYCSPNLLPSGMHKQINASDADVVNLHWISKQMISIREIGLIDKPLVWTLHDMWMFCGAEHYAPDSEGARFQQGYLNTNRPTEEKGLDLNKYVWNRKRDNWRRSMTVVCPSHWLAECAKRSLLLRNMRIEVIPNPLDTAVWRPIPQNTAREILRLPLDCQIVLFGAIGGTTDARKGADILLKALKLLPTLGSGSIQLVVFGQSEPLISENFGLPVRYLGHLHDDASLALVYSAADVMLVPSRQEAFGQTASEAHACGTPVVAFNTGGLPDIVDHKKTGYLAKPNDAIDLAQGITWTLEDSHRLKQLSSEARQKAVEHFSTPIVAKLYRDLYESITTLR